MNSTTRNAWRDAAEIVREWKGDDEATVELLRLVWRWQDTAYSPYLNILANALETAWGVPSNPRRKHELQ